MKQDIINNELQVRQKYVPASVKVIKITVCGAILAASNPNSPEKYSPQSW